MIPARPHDPRGVGRPPSRGRGARGEVSRFFLFLGNGPDFFVFGKTRLICGWSDWFAVNGEDFDGSFAVVADDFLGFADADADESCLDEVAVPALDEGF